MRKSLVTVGGIHRLARRRVLAAPRAPGDRPRRSQRRLRGQRRAWGRPGRRQHHRLDLVERLFSERRFDYVFHLAAYAAEGLSHFIKRFNYTNNLLGSVNLINASVNTVSPCWGRGPDGIHRREDSDR